MKFCRAMGMNTSVYILSGVLNIHTAQKTVRFYHILVLFGTVCVYGYTEDNVSQLVFG